MAKKSGIEKKLNIIIKESEVLCKQGKFSGAVRKLREGLTLIRTKIKNSQEQKQELENVKEKINSIFILEIDYIIDQANKLIEQNNFNNALEEFKKASSITFNISDPHQREIETNIIEKLKRKTEIKALIEQGKNLKKEKQYIDAIVDFKKVLDEAMNYFDLGDELISDIEEMLNNTYSEYLKELAEPANKLKENNQFEESINLYEDLFIIIEEMSESEEKNNNINQIQNEINEAYSNLIKFELDKGKELLKQDNIKNAEVELKKAINLSQKMYDSDLKTAKIKEMGDLMNPIYLNRIKPIIEEGNKIIEQKDFYKSIFEGGNALSKFNEALGIINSMIESDDKAKELVSIKTLINHTCMAGITPRKERGILLIEEKKFDEAIKELYSVLSIAKNLKPLEGEEIEEIDHIKLIINKVYSAEVEEIIKNGNNLVEKGNYDEAMNLFNTALSVTNKMYLSEEMDKEVSKIKNVIYQTELKQILKKGNLSEKEDKFSEEIERLNELLEHANVTKDPEHKAEEMEIIRRKIDQVHSDRINLLIEQANQLAEQVQFEAAFDQFEQAIKITNLIELREIKNTELTKIIDNYIIELNNKAKRDLNSENFEDSIKCCSKAIELDEKHVESYYNLGNTYRHQEVYDKANESYKKAIELDSNHANAWNDMGIVHIFTTEPIKAIDAYKKAIEIDPNHANAWFNIGIAYKSIEEYEQAIEAFNQALDIDPNYSKAWFFMGSVYYDIKQYDSAVKHIESGYKLNVELGKELAPLVNDFKKIISSIDEKLKNAFTNLIK